MPRASQCLVVLVTVPDRKTARLLSKAILTARLAACVNLVPQLESHYWWQGKLHQDREVLLVIKTTPALVAQLQKRVLELHPYDTPEFLVLPVKAGSRRYLDWVVASTRAS